MGCVSGCCCSLVVASQRQWLETSHGTCIRHRWHVSVTLDIISSQLENIGSRFNMQTTPAAAERVTVTVFITVWPFDLWVNACWANTIEVMCTMFGVDSSSHFPFSARTNRQTWLNALPMRRLYSRHGWWLTSAVYEIVYLMALLNLLFMRDMELFSDNQSNIFKICTSQLAEYCVAKPVF